VSAEEDLRAVGAVAEAARDVQAEVGRGSVAVVAGRAEAWAVAGDPVVRGRLEGHSMIIAVASGKGGTGKTTVAVNLALSISNAQYIDCDVEEPDGHLFLRPEIQTRRAVTMPVPRIHEDACTLCSECAEACEFNALALSKKRVLVFPDLCHGCGACSYVCPEPGAISETERRIGEVAMGVIPRGIGAGIGFAQGILEVGELAPSPLIKQAKQCAEPAKTVILDAPPGTACPMVATLRGVDYCVLVTEPTPFGLEDLRLAVAVVRELGVKCGVVVNRCDIGDRAVAEYCLEEALPLLMEIPFHRELAVAYSRGVPWVEADRGARAHFQDLFQAVLGQASA
jgi:MinD superfamily P-loop ATPase